eukprot:TRINITY_DN10195_c0_g2_i1.p1 TRINITY_DN10195_c0_g2~~TRINITY_DN10195_c0_g2_i1.p1  ORF type:complete len:155 (+),score=21.59 TRINITY_DN10195_c0_g2_i1:214-678(+)
MLLFTHQLNVRYGSQGLVAVACNPGAVYSDIWREAVRGLAGRMFALFMRICFLSTDQGSHTSVTAALADSTEVRKRGLLPYCQPYFLALGPRFLMPFEMAGPFVGSCWGIPRTPTNLSAEAERVWRVSAEMVEGHMRADVAGLKRHGKAHWKRA